MSRRLVATSSGLALAADVAAKVGLLLVTVVAARTLPAGELAQLGTVLAAAGIVAVLLDAGAGVLITRDGARDRAVGSGLLTALSAARVPVAAVLLAATAVAGSAAGEPMLWLAAVLLGILGAASVSLIGLFRSGQDMRPEARQKILFAALAVAGTVVVVASPTAEALAVMLVVATAASLAPLAGRVLPLLRDRRPARPRTALRRALPLGLLAMATVVYYRSGTVALAVLSTPDETATFTVAATIGFGLLLLPNALTTGLLPHLAAHRGGVATGTTRWAMRWSLVLSVPIAVLAAVAGYLLLGPVFGAQYAGAAAPLALLCGSVCLVACSGILGTALIAAGHVTAVAVQVACSLAVNIAALALLVPRYGATGAATATLLCEAVAVVILVATARRALPGFGILSRRAHGPALVGHRQPTFEG